MERARTGASARTGAMLVAVIAALGVIMVLGFLSNQGGTTAGSICEYGTYEVQQNCLKEIGIN